MPDKPDAEKRSTFHAVLDFLKSKTGFVLVCVAVTVTGLVKWRDLVALFHGEKSADAADKGKAAAPDPGDVKIGPAPGYGPKKNPAPPVTVIPPNAAPVVRAKPDAVTFAPGELTRRVELLVDDEEPGSVAVAAVTGPGSSAGLIPASGLKVAGTAATRFLDVTIDPEKWGTAVVRVTATDKEKLAAESTIRVTVPAPALTIAEIPDVSVTLGEPLPIVTVAVTDSARKPAKVTVTPVATDPLFPAGGVTLDADGKTLRLAPKAGTIGTATVTLIAQADDGRETRRSFNVIVARKPIRDGCKATVVVALPEGGLDLDAKGTNKVLGSPALDKGTKVSVKQVQGKRCQIEWAAGGETHLGWVDVAILVSVDEP